MLVAGVEDLMLCRACSLKLKKHFTHLLRVKQKEGETLKAYIARWQKEVQVVEGLDDKSTLTMFIESL